MQAIVHPQVPNMQWVDVSTRGLATGDIRVAALSVTHMFERVADSDQDIEVVCGVLLQRFGRTALFRCLFIEHNSDGSYTPVGQMCIPVHAPWQSVTLKKKKGRTDASKSFEITLIVPPQTTPSAGVVHEKFVFTIPYDGPNGEAELFYKALEWARGTVLQSFAGQFQIGSSSAA